MSARLVRDVLIVGAGSAGWLTALVLRTYCPYLRVKLIRPRRLPTIGVGESTQADFLRVLRDSRIDMQRFYVACDATMKCGIYYEDWDAIGEHYWHPFSNLALTASYTAAHHYQQMILRQPERFTHAGYCAAVHSSFETCVERRLVAPESAAALHVDAVKITAHLEEALPDVEVLEADQVDVETADGRVSAVVLDGSRRFVFGRVAEPELVVYEPNVNRVVTAQIPHADPPTEVTPYTRAHAHRYGWTWTIPLQSRIGSGYVYHADFCSTDDAERAFRGYWGEERLRDVDLRHISFDSKSLRNPWVANVVAIGLSAGFVEPLEATGLSWTITSADLLCQSLGARFFDADTAAKYNANMLGYVYDIQDFLDAHYKLSHRRDSEFWRYQATRSYPDRLEARLALYAAEMPSDANRIKTSPWAFNEVSWLDILNGYRFEYARLDVHPTQIERAREALRAIGAEPRRGIDPRTCQPNDPRASA
jgi:tryptophan halogenase